MPAPSCSEGSLECAAAAGAAALGSAPARGGRARVPGDAADARRHPRADRHEPRPQPRAGIERRRRVARRAGAGGAAHLPGMVAAISPLPIVGVPTKSSNSIDGWDSILSILQLPGGVPVATVALNGAKNAGILAAQIVGSSDQDVLERIVQYKENLRQAVEDKEAMMVIGHKKIHGQGRDHFQFSPLIF